MMAFARKARQARVPFFFDPGQSLNIWKGNELREAVEGALCFISNDYELSLFLQMTQWDISDLYNTADVVITTMGPQGAVFDLKGERTLVPAIPVENVVDPTGAGDAFRAGVLKAIQLNLPWDIACQMGVTIASFSVEQYGTQEHKCDWESFCARYEKAFGRLVC